MTTSFPTKSRKSVTLSRTATRTLEDNYQKWFLSFLLVAHHISEYQAKSLLCRPAEIGSLRGGQDVGIPEIFDEPATFRLKNKPVDELHELFQAPETAFTDAEDCLKENHTDNLFD